ncbi:RusA family crossover junction endodeoxyribonuclease [Cohnella xylanilytica]|uniref:RusA family crossover junction endodeoxyribonuclease n=1 Tax=Cohnella xylanilytica TaxID=557555 RepID=A0A841TWE3_9BACL|nr:RusA family crossover junction endodeoxyribonuclease [Cohnella xylanilytica]
MKITVPGELPTLNEIIDLAKSHWAKYRESKTLYTELVAWSAFRRPKQDKVNVIIHWFRANKRHDKDNIMAGQKYIFDGLKEAGIIGNDGWKHIGDVAHRFDVDNNNPRVEIELYPADRYDFHYEIIDKQKVVCMD